ncbi:histidine--tRNA ligase [Winogradskyella maritima]|uniref:Histidine--tRNA ligase n=1 Tax=Winogradskyella maritima TaxID=1517766 RepID=A0ABV8AD17_9FLAO|nr:histidine--tRNA ligase [Winogradskyella maritima]
MAQKPSIPKGTRDFNSEEVSKRNYIIDTIKSQFQLFGFQPIETPSFEHSDTLMGKYGDEGDRLIFKILNSGEYLKGVDETFYLNIIRIQNLIRDGYERLLKHLKAQNDLNSLFERDEQGFMELINEWKIFQDQDYELFGFRKSYILLKLSRAFYESNFGENKNLSYSYTGLLVKEILDKYIRESSNKIVSSISEKALRYDLTVPFARYVVQHQNDIEFPFKRYQIQPVWRADRPQKGRFREFFQCDADVVGSTSLLQEVEFIQLYDAVFTSLRLEGVTIKINNRKILSGIAEVIGAQDKLIDFTVALDKLDKIGEEKVKQEMRNKGISEAGIENLQPLFALSGDFSSQVESLKSILATSDIGQKGIEELQFISDAIETLGLKTAKLQLDVTLARGLNYYTGAIFEVSAPEGVKMGSIGGGGRYDDLTGIFGLKNMSGVGISFGLDRIYLVLEELGLFPETVSEQTKVLFINFGSKEAMGCLKAIKALREKGVKAELYPDDAKMKKQMNHANRRNIPYVVLVGEQELEASNFTLKNMASGEQSTLSLSDLLQKLS